MFNDIDKKLRFTAVLNLVFGVGYAYYMIRFVKIVTEYNYKSEPVAYFEGPTFNLIFIILAAVSCIVSILSVIISIALTKNRLDGFKWLSGAAKALRVAASVFLVLGAIAVFCLCFWLYFNAISFNTVVNNITVGITSFIPLAAVVYSFCCFLYGLGNAADGNGDAKYVQDSKLFGMEPLHTDEDPRKVCPNCGTRTDRHNCPNCGARIDL